MRGNPFLCAVIVAAMMPTAAFADDPNDPSMRNAAARARDRELTRQLNLEEQASVRERDARATQGWRAARSRDNAAANEYAARSRDHDRAVANYNRSRAQYEQDMAGWRRAVAACRAGDYSACSN